MGPQMRGRMLTGPKAAAVLRAMPMRTRPLPPLVPLRLPLRIALPRAYYFAQHRRCCCGEGVQIETAEVAMVAFPLVTDGAAMSTRTRRQSY